MADDRKDQLEIPEAHPSIDKEELEEYRAIRKAIAEFTGRNPVGARYTLDSSVTTFNFGQPSVLSLSIPKRTG